MRTLSEANAGVTQLVEYLPSKQAVVSSSLVPRSTRTHVTMPKSGALHFGAPRLISLMGRVWGRTKEKLPLIWPLDRPGSCWWDVDHAGWVVTLDAPERQKCSGPTLEEALAGCWCG